MRVPPRASGLETALLLTVSALSLLVFFWLPPPGLHADDGGIKYIQMRSFQRNGWSSLTIPYPAHQLDEEFEFLGKTTKLVSKGGRVLCTYPPLFSFLSSLAVPFAGDRAVHLVPLLAFLLSIVALRATLALITDRTSVRLTLILLYAVASPIPVYSITFYEHLPAVLCTVVGLYYATLYFAGEGAPRNVLLSLAIMTSGVFFRSEMLVLSAAFAAPLFFWSLASNRRSEAKMVVLGLAIPLGAYCLFNQLAYGSVLGLHIALNQPRRVFSPFSLVLFLLALAAVPILFELARRSDDRSTLAVLLPVVWVGILLSFLRRSVVPALFAQFPPVMFMFYRPPATERDLPRDSGRFADVLAVTLILFLSLMALLFLNNPDPSVRYTLPAVPIVIVLLGIRFRSILGSRFTPLLLGVLALLSLGSNTYLGSKILHFKQFNNDRVAFLGVNTEEGDVIVFQSNSLLEHAGPLYFQRRLMVASEPEQLVRLLDRLRNHDIRTCYYNLPSRMADVLEKELAALGGPYRITKRASFRALSLLRIEIEG